MQGEDDITTIARLLAHHAKMINLISLQLGDQACLLAPSLVRCGRCDIEPITVEHRHMGLQACDRCAAELIVRSGRNYVEAYCSDPNDPLNEARSSLMNEDDWLDLPNADKVRRITDYVRIIKVMEGSTIVAAHH